MQHKFLDRIKAYCRPRKWTWLPFGLAALVVIFVMALTYPIWGLFVVGGVLVGGIKDDGYP